MKTHKLFTFSITTLLTATTTSAAIVAGQTIGLDFGLAGDGINAPTNNFNGDITFGTITTLTDLSGVTVSGVSFMAASNGTKFQNNDAAIGPFTGHTFASVFTAENHNDFVGSYSGVGGNNITLTFSGLDDNLSYDFTGMSAFDDRNLAITYSAAGATPTLVATNGVSPVAVFTGLRSTGNQLTITVSTLDVVGINAATLTATAVPEPTSTAFLGLGSLALILRRRK